MTKAAAGKVRRRLREHALGFPEAWQDHPWEGDSVVKVGKKIFAFFGPEEGEWWPTMTVKLADSHALASSQPGVSPATYGLGRSGWVTVKLDECRLPYEVLADWVEESYRAVAPKKLSAQLAER